MDCVNSTPSFSRAVLAPREPQKFSAGAADTHLIFRLHSIMAGGTGQLMSTMPFSNMSATVTFNQRWQSRASVSSQTGEAVPLPDVWTLQIFILLMMLLFLLPSSAEYI